MAKIMFYRRRNLLGSTGGVERVLVNLSNNFVEKGHEVFLTSYDKKGKNLFFKLNEKVSLHRFEKDFSLIRFGLFNLFKKFNMLEKLPYFDHYLYRSKFINQYCEDVKPDVIIASSPFDLVDIKASGLNDIPVILMLHGHPRIYFKKKRVDLFKKYINQAAVVQVLLPSYIANMPEYVNVPTVSIGNYINPIGLSKKTENVIIYLATIVSHKGQDSAIKAFAKIKDKHPDWQMHFWGGVLDNSYYDKCKSLIEKNNLEKQVFFKGLTSNSEEEICKAKVSIFPSTSEGLPLALMEVLSAGLPSVGFKECPGVNELIIDGQNGFLADDIDDLAGKLSKLLEDESLRDDLGKEASKISQEYSIDKILTEWLDLIEDLKNKYKTN